MDQNITNKIYTIRGEKVMLDYDLAKFYGYTTSAFNRQVKNNQEKFSEEEFMFQLSKTEAGEFLRCKNYILDGVYVQHFKYLPYAFTEQGIYMLMTVLKGKLAIQQSKTLIRLFKNMKDYVVENKILLDSKARIRDYNFY